MYAISSNTPWEYTVSVYAFKSNSSICCPGQLLVTLWDFFPRITQRGVYWASSSALPPLLRMRNHSTKGMKGSWKHICGPMRGVFVCVREGQLGFESGLNYVSCGCGERMWCVVCVHTHTVKNKLFLHLFWFLGCFFLKQWNSVLAHALR